MPVITRKRPVVALSSDLITAVQHAAGERLHLVTPDTTRLTLPASDLLLGSGARWVVRRGAEHFCGHTGTPLWWDGAGFTPAGPPPAPVAPAVSGVLLLDVAVHHPFSSALELGEVLEECVSGLTGGAVLGWGVCEPVTQRWSRARLTELCAERVPEPTKLVVLGGTSAQRVLGCLTAGVVPDGVLEHVRVGIGCPFEPDPVVVERVLSQVANGFDVRMSVTSFRAGLTDCTVSAAV